MDLQDQMCEAVRQRKQAAIEARKQFAEVSRKRLAAILEKKLNTAFIGAIASMEEFIGRRLWGHGKRDSERTPQEQAWHKVWQECRNEILTNGNNQLRAVRNELVLYKVDFVGYQLNLQSPNPEDACPPPAPARKP